MRLITELERVADREANTWSTVARRLLAAGLAREARNNDLDNGTRNEEPVAS